MMNPNKYMRLLLGTFLIVAPFLAQAVSAFAPSSPAFILRGGHRDSGSSTSLNNDSAKGGDSLLTNLIDGISKVVASSPLNEGKKAIAKLIAGDYDKAAVKARLEALINEEPVLMLSFTTCPYCLKAKEILKNKGVAFRSVELDVEADGMPLRSEMANMIGRTSVPAIWIDKTFVGGCNDGGPSGGGIVALSQGGKLDEMMKELSGRQRE